MTDKVRLGTMLIANGTHMPDSFVIRTEPYSAGWSVIDTAGPAQFGREIEAVGWTFFYMAGDVCAHGFGTNDQSRTKRAVAHLIDAVQLQHCNSLQITEITQRSFCGVPYTSIVARARHIQESPSFHPRSKAPLPAVPSPQQRTHDRTHDVPNGALLIQGAVNAWENEGGSRI